ncbi:vesicle transport protein [Thamnocephalis sphaerospora]|uniref:Vesicle transport protein n=1 Tax=Thamnocephalis sphaerospora TaxID=78915 RepID=A0A4V1IWX9_9FUNG|nr:vesicle transport protein [Thamnocephalis sphaerospora]|eukprot:RKP09119.1 vesicle transport protein [Thamnocephalis sphaerospora]
MLTAATLTAPPSRRETDFRRLLIRTEALLEDGDENLLCVTPKSAKLASNLRSMKKTLEDWRSEKNAQEYDKAVLSAYTQTIHRLSRMIDDTKLTSPVDRTSAQSRAAAFSDLQGRMQAKETLQELRLRRRAENVMKEALLQEKQGRVANVADDGIHGDARQSFGDASARKELGSAADRNAGDLESILRRDRAIHDELTDDMLRLTKVLKNNVSTFGDILTRDEQVLDGTQTAMMTSIDRLGKEGQRLTVFRQQASKTTAFTWTVLLLVCLMFVLTFMFIRLFPKQY